jgi:hypothetical protein
VGGGACDRRRAARGWSGAAGDESSEHLERQAVDVGIKVGGDLVEQLVNAARRSRAVVSRIVCVP